MLDKKQNVFDDFIAAAEWLVANRYTEPGHLAIRGASNGGLLVGAAFTQRPELFRAVLCDFPDLDMLGYYRFPNNNPPALLEYGNASIPEQFQFLHAYSPYQRVKDGTPYPAVFFTTGDADTRVPPLQARKMTARVQAATSSGRPVLLLYHTKAGHAGGRPVGKVVDDLSLQLAFLAGELGMEVAPAPGVTDGPYAPQPILPGGLVVPLYPPGSPDLKAERVREAEVYNMAAGVPGRIQSILNIHNPSIEVHVADPAINTGAAVVVVAGGAHRTLNVGSEGADVVTYLYNYGVNSVILRNRLRNDGYVAEVDAVQDALRAIRLTRARAAEWKIDPQKVGIMGFSAGAELAAATGVFFAEFDEKHRGSADPLEKVSARPSFVVLVYPGPTPFARGASPKIPRNVPPSFLVTAGSGDRVHAIWADEYFSAMLKLGVPNLEMHVYGNGVHGGGLKHRDGIPFGTWPDRFIEWFRDLGFLGKPGVETRAERDVAAFASQPPAP
jgi:acetyl esterase/lipase